MELITRLIERVFSKTVNINIAKNLLQCLTLFQAPYTHGDVFEFSTKVNPRNEKSAHCYSVTRPKLFKMSGFLKINQKTEKEDRMHSEQGGENGGRHFPLPGNPRLPVSERNDQ